MHWIKNRECTWDFLRKWIIFYHDYYNFNIYMFIIALSPYLFMLIIDVCGIPFLLYISYALTNLEIAIFIAL